MGKRLLTLAAMVAGIALLIAGVAFAAGDLAQSDEPTTTAVTVEPAADDESTTTTSTTAVTVEPPVVDDSTTSTTTSTETPGIGDKVTVNEVPTSPHDGGWGKYISDLREQGIHTPAAVLMGKTVPGWEKKHPPTTETPTTETPTTEAPTTEAPSTEQATSKATNGHGHGKK